MVRVLTGGADVGTYLVHHPKVRHVHMTGSAATHDAIVSVRVTRAPAARRRAHCCSTSRPPANWAGSPPRSCCRAAGPRRTCATRPSTSASRSCTTTATTA
ncbi:aldehyde dehydrogenase family protein [Streptomyces rishiriensis]|uniref:aldehyde dehydrogenase family protein n=1 Tax=Streptomyces rishiriensis TaxID=68264 RepID=UPI002482072A|nr:aldehyde dehydrogenase family protein [Streptomyces rishiriensis]